MAFDLAADPARHADGGGIAAACEIYYAMGICCAFTGSVEAVRRS